MRFSLILLALSLLVASCAQAPETKLAAPVTRLVLHSQLPESAPQTKLVKQFAQDAARRAAGRLQIDVVTDAPGGAWPRNVFALLQQGKADLVLGYVNTIGFREGQIGMLPGLVNSREQSLRFADTTLAQLLASRLEAQVQARKLFWLWEKSVIASRGRPVRLPGDARNLGAVRAVGPYIDLFREIGAATTAVALSEVWTTMQRGLVSAAVVPAWMLAGAPATAADAVVVPDGDVGFYSLIAVAISPKSFDRLPPDLQRVLVESAAQAEWAAPALLAQEDQLAAGVFASQGKSVVALDWRSFDAWIRLAREKTWIPVIGRMQTDERMINAVRQFVIGRADKATPAPATGNETTWDRVANIRAAATRMAHIHKEAGFFGGFEEVKKCYAEAKLEQGYTKEIEFCMAQDYAGSHAAAATYSSVSPESLRLSGSPAPEVVINGMRDRITAVFQRLRIPQAEGMAFSTMLREHALPTYAQARFQDKKN